MAVLHLIVWMLWSGGPACLTSSSNWPNGAIFAASEPIAIVVRAGSSVWPVNMLSSTIKAFRIEAYTAPQAPAVTAMEYVYLLDNSVIASQNIIPPANVLASPS